MSTGWCSFTSPPPYNVHIPPWALRNAQRMLAFVVDRGFFGGCDASGLVTDRQKNCKLSGPGRLARGLASADLCFSETGDGVLLPDFPYGGASLTFRPNVVETMRRGAVYVTEHKAQDASERK
jgi:hypothetical protein